MNTHFRRCRVGRIEPVFRSVVINKTSTHYYLNIPSVTDLSNSEPLLPTLSWVSPPPLDPAEMSKMSVRPTSTVHHHKRRVSLSPSERMDYMNLDAADKKRLLFGGPSQQLSATRRSNVNQRQKNDSDTDTEGGMVKKRSQSSSSASHKRLSVALEGSKPNFKMLPPFTDLLVTDPMPFIADSNDPSRNSLLVPEGAYFHVQDDRCMNKKKYMDFPKCRSCIWKHRERLPYCFFVGFRAFLVKLDEDSPSSQSPQVKLETSNPQTVGGLPLLPCSTDKMRLMNDVPAENLVYGPYFIPNGIDIPSAITATGPSGLQPSNFGSVKRKLKNSGDRDFPSFNDEDSDDMQMRPPKRKYVRRPKSLPLYSHATRESSSSPLETYQQEIAGVLPTSATSPLVPIPPAPKPSQIHKNSKPRTGNDSNDFPDLVASAAFPFVPKPDAPHLNALIISPDRRYHVQDDKCLNKRYLDFPKCRSCRWKHKERLPHCFYIGFRVFGVSDDYQAESLIESGESNSLSLEVFGKIPPEKLVYGPFFSPGGSDTVTTKRSKHPTAKSFIQGREETAESVASEIKEPSVVSDSAGSSKALCSGDEKDLEKTGKYCSDTPSEQNRNSLSDPGHASDGAENASANGGMMDVDRTVDAGQTNNTHREFISDSSVVLTTSVYSEKVNDDSGDCGDCGGMAGDTEIPMDIDAPAPLENDTNITSNVTYKVYNSDIDFVERRISAAIDSIDEHVNAGEEGLMMLAAVARVDANGITPPALAVQGEHQIRGFAWKENSEVKKSGLLSDEILSQTKKIPSKLSSGFKLSRMYSPGKTQAASAAGTEKLLVLPANTVPNSSALPKAAVGSATTPVCDN
ncbi:hypothetical protein HDU83_000114 [Entophlyctis luteolus]|nr:hypothetical protein HDU83_000114 [Entophlyctis luteolus]